jgi:hypothetical protein
MNKIISYINENEIDQMVAAIFKQGKDIDFVIQQIKDSRVEYQKKSQELQWDLEKHFKGDR